MVGRLARSCFHFLREKQTPILLVVSAAAAFLLSSCNTFVGVGRDAQRLGQGVENTAYGKKW